jgi:tRNA pseudouridine13 synthase
MIDLVFDPARLPYATGALAGIGGRIKLEPNDFVVEEIALYEPVDSGEHVYVRLRRAGWTTRDVLASVARLFAVDARDLGCAGQKDKRALATQTISIPIAALDPGEVARRIRDELGFEILWARRHTNKLRRGHLLGNRFEVLVASAHPDRVARAAAIARALETRGLPNFYGPQRFGANGDNAVRGRALLDAPRGGWADRFLMSALQASLFNAWLGERMRRDLFAIVLAGDVAKRVDNGALFDVVDAAAENERMSRREITFTGPIHGARMRCASGVPAELEREVLASSDVDAGSFARARLSGSRRAARLYVDDLEIAEQPGGVRLRFSLPKGAYATTLVRELTKAELPLDLDEPGE